MSRPQALTNFTYSEQIANVATRVVPALPAMIFNDSSLQLIEGQYYLVFDWVDGRTLKANEIRYVHCEKIGEVLARLHLADFSGLGPIRSTSSDMPLTDWGYYLKTGQEKQLDWIDCMTKNLDQLYHWNTKANEAEAQLAKHTVISHLDLDAKNVLWCNHEPILIDWEASGSINPLKNVVETALYWAEEESGDLSRERFAAFFAGYFKKADPIQTDWNNVLTTGFSGMLGWLEYSLKRSLGIECTDATEQLLGTEQVTGTLLALQRYAARISEVEGWLSDICNNRHH